MNEQVSLALADRAASYGLLARLFNREVDEELLEGLRALPFPDDTGSASFDEANRLMGSYLAAADERTRTELAVDFARLFVVRRRSTRTAPYPNESVHTSEEHLVMDRARDEVRALYRAEGLRASDAARLGEDHIALELEFMQVGAQRAAAAYDEGDGEELRRLLDVQAAFLDEHLLNWVPSFAATMEQVARTGFYRGLAKLLVAHLREDRTLVDEVRNLDA